MSDRIVTLVSAENAVEAHVIRGRLATEGIDAFVAGEMTGTSLAIVGTALGGVKVHVHESDYERACAVLSAIEERDDPALEGVGPRDASKPDWKCPQCGGHVPWDFDLCWGCGTAVDQTQRTPEVQADAAEPSAGETGPGGGVGTPTERDSSSLFRDPDQVANHLSEADSTAWECPACAFRALEPRELCPACGAIPDSQVNPYRYTGALDAEPEPLPPRPAASDELEAVVGRAFRASIFGTIFCPPLLCPYATYLLLYIAFQNVELSPSANRKFYVALAVNLLVGIPLTGVFLMYLLQGYAAAVFQFRV